jgi:hypothetical protein
MYIGMTLKEKLLHYVHASPLAGHAGYNKTLHRARRDFYWLEMKSDIEKFIRKCDIFQRVKAENISSAGLLQPLPIPDRAWVNIAMDFIEGLPVSHGQRVIWVVVDRLTKCALFMSLAHPYTVATLARIVIKNIFKLHGMPSSITDRDSFHKQILERNIQSAGCALGN